MPIETMPVEPAPSENVPFEGILVRLQKVVDDLERGDLPLEQSLAIFEEGVQLSRLGQRRLEEAEQRVERLLGDESGGVRTRPFEEDEKK
jgi:exodeoxyribonuclease VII small subunit